MSIEGDDLDDMFSPSGHLHVEQCSLSLKTETIHTSNLEIDSSLEKEEENEFEILKPCFPEFEKPEVQFEHKIVTPNTQNGFQFLTNASLKYHSSFNDLFSEWRSQCGDSFRPVNVSLRISDMELFKSFNQEYKSKIRMSEPPSRTCIGTSFENSDQRIDGDCLSTIKSF